ncbi:MAG: PilT/PilU family type 4a pilus ATPase [Candidatus Pacebacteria bacterium]|nr:PilT/PilU family type 4a pilus ATPase [Candidatus Paceibacterota bacterium]
MNSENNKYKKIIEDLVKIIEQESASDLHISEGRYPTIRVDGVLMPINIGDPYTSEDLEEIIRIFLDPTSIEIFKQNKEFDFSWSSNGQRFRGNIFFQQGSISLVLRAINQEIKTFEELNLPEILEVFARKKQGFFLVVGPTGHGKSTTLASIIETININRSAHILTIEDPVEYLYSQKKSIIDQREVKIDTKNFSNALRSMFRQDIDVALIGEMRGSETIETAVTAAETGHLVFSTLHTNSASQTIDRIIDTFPPEGQKQIRNQLAASLIGVFSQRLIPSVSGGRVPAYELLINNNAVANLIREGRIAEIDSYIETSSEKGMISLNKSLSELVRKGEISVEDAFINSPKSQALKRLL